MQGMKNGFYDSHGRWIEIGNNEERQTSAYYANKEKQTGRQTTGMESDVITM